MCKNAGNMTESQLDKILKQYAKSRGITFNDFLHLFNNVAQVAVEVDRQLDRALKNEVTN